MKIFKKIKYFFTILRNNWKIKFRLVIKNDDTHQEKWSLLLTPKKIFILTICFSLLLIMLTTFLIAFTPLRYYIPGYTNPQDLRNYQEISARMKSLETKYTVNKDYLEMLTHVLNEDITDEEDNTTVEALNKAALEKENIPVEEIEKRKKAYETFDEEVEMIYAQISEMPANTGVSVPLTQRINHRTPFLLPPTFGIVISEFDMMQKKYGIMIKNAKNTMVNSVAEGTVIYSGFDPKNGNTIVIQHTGNIITVYKNNQSLLKSTGSKVKAGEAVAKMGNMDYRSQDGVLIFEIWYHGIPVNPLDYIMIK
jgi:murein DD-endopeptidase MepM/ murein hydrolase activator NlpD